MTPESVNQVIVGISDFVLRYAITLAAVGTLSMALLEAVKAVLSWRDRFHKRLVRRWVEQAPVQPVPPMLSELPRRTEDELRSRAYADLIKLTTGETVGPAAICSAIQWLPWALSRADALFGLPIEKMMGQIQDAADATLSYPHLHPELYLFLTAGADEADVANWYRWAQQPPVRSTENAAEAKRQADTFARLRQLIRRRLDVLQLTASYRWQTGNQIVAVVLGAALLYGSLVYLDPRRWVVFILPSLAGGLVAPVAKDLVAALKRVRGGG